MMMMVIMVTYLIDGNQTHVVWSKTSRSLFVWTRIEPRAVTQNFEIEVYIQRVD